MPLHGEANWQPIGVAPENGVKDRRRVREHYVPVDLHQVAKMMSSAQAP